jgi:hypothetical protein
MVSEADANKVWDGDKPDSQVLQRLGCFLIQEEQAVELSKAAGTTVLQSP